jgi:hypothetical protein
MTTEEACLSFAIVIVAFAGLIKASRDLWIYVSESSDYGTEDNE